MSKWIMEHDEAWWQDDGSFSCPLGQLTKAEVEQAVVRFRAFDVDEDGVVSYEDFNTAMIRHNPALAHPSQTTHLRHMFRAADIDGSGTIDVIDFVLMRLRNKQESTQPERAAKAWALPSTGNTASASSSASASASASASLLQVDQDRDESPLAKVRQQRDAADERAASEAVTYEAYLDRAIQVRLFPAARGQTRLAASPASCPPLRPPLHPST